jgi:hypothetical protein
MAEIAVNPIVMKNAVVQFGTDDFAAAVASAAFTPNNGGAVTFRGLKRSSSFSFPGARTWTFDMEYAQDHAVATALAGYLYANRDDVVSVTFIVDDDDATPTEWTADVYIAPGAIGGAVDTVPTGTVSLPVKGEPVPAYNVA